MIRVCVSVLLLCPLLLAGACQNNSNKSKNEVALPSLSEGQFVTIHKPDTFFLKISGPQPLIAPGGAIGRFSVGEKTDSLQVLRRPDSGDAGMCKSLSRWLYGDSSHEPRKELVIFSACDPDDDMRPHIKWIRTTDPAFKTAGGLGVGSNWKALSKAYPDVETVATYQADDSTTVEMLHVKDQGITFEVRAPKGTPRAKDTCVGVVVHGIATKMPSMYFPFYHNLQIRPSGEQEL